MGHGDSVANEILVGGIPTPLKILVIGMIIPNIWKIKAMFQTTNQYKNIQNLGQMVATFRPAWW
jgi:hypothetical protein